MHAPVRRVVAVILGFVVLGSAGCASRVTRENYDRIHDGMSVSEVEGILGKPDKDKRAGFAFGDVDASGGVMVWESGDKMISVTVAQGKVVVKVQKGL